MEIHRTSKALHKLEHGTRTVLVALYQLYKTASLSKLIKQFWLQGKPIYWGENDFQALSAAVLTCNSFEQTEERSFYRQHMARETRIREAGFALEDFMLGLPAPEAGLADFPGT